MPNESRFPRIVNRLGEIQPTSSSELSTHMTAITPIQNNRCENIHHFPAFLHTAQSETNKVANPVYQTPYTQEAYGGLFPPSLHGECSTEKNNWEISSQQIPHISEKNNRLMMPKLNKAYLKLFNQNLVDIMCSGKQCSNCGNRFKVGEIGRHLDMHFQMNSARRQAYKPCRSYYETIEQFCGENHTVEDVLVSFGQEKNMKRQHKKGLHTSNTVDICCGCHEVIDQFFNDEDEEWQLDDAVNIDGNTYHRICAHTFDSK